MQRLSYAFRFIKTCFSLAIKQSRLRKPWFNLWMGGIALIIVWLVPLGAVIILAGLDSLGLALIGLISILLLLSLCVWGEVTALETCKVFVVLIQEDQDIDQVKTEKLRHEFARWQDVILWTISLPSLEMFGLLRRVFMTNKDDKLDWLGASYLMLPVISLEDHSLADASVRIKQLVQERLLRFHPNLVGIRPVVSITQWILVLGGAALGLWSGLNLADPLTTNLLSRLLAAALGTSLAGILTILGIFFSSFIRACYYTTLYQWALNVEKARRSGDSSLSKPPAILGQVLRKTILSKKDI